MSISIKGVSKSYGTQKALDDVNLEIGEGQVVGLLGPNGAGKSTLMKITTGYLAADAGAVSVCGVDVAAEPLKAKSVIGYLPEHNPLYLDMYVREYVSMVARMYGVRNLDSRVEAMLESTGLMPECHKKIGALSKGYRQRVGIAQAIVGDPRVVILDEPTTGLDPNQILEIRQLIRSLATNRTVVLSTHIMQEVEAVCDDIIIIDHGKIKAQGATADVVAHAGGGQTVEVEFLGPIDVQAIKTAVKANSVEVLPSNTYRIRRNTAGDDMRPRIFRFAVEHGYVIVGMQALQADVATLFRKLTVDS